MKHTSKYLYAVSPDQFRIMNYEDALRLKIKLARGVMSAIIMDGRLDEERYLAAQKAVEFNRKLIEELYDEV